LAIAAVFIHGNQFLVAHHLSAPPMINRLHFAFPSAHTPVAHRHRSTGTAFGASKPIRIKSAFFPTSSDQSLFSDVQCTCALDGGQFSTTAFAPKRTAGSILVIFWSFAARSISQLKSRSLLLPAGPSVAQPDGNLPARANLRSHGRKHAPRLLAYMYSRDDCARNPPAAAHRIFRSVSSTKMQCAAYDVGPRIRACRRYCTGVVPFCARLSSQFFFLSGDVMRIGAPYFRASARRILKRLLRTGINTNAARPRRESGHRLASALEISTVYSSMAALDLLSGAGNQEIVSPSTPRIPAAFVSSATASSK